MNFTHQIRKERGRQIDLGYTEQENDENTEQDWDRILTNWYAFLLQDIFTKDLLGFRRHLVQFATVAASLGATEQRFAEGTGWLWHDARGDGDISNPPEKDDGER